MLNLAARLLAAAAAAVAACLLSSTEANGVARGVHLGSDGLCHRVRVSRSLGLKEHDGFGAERKTYGLSGLDTVGLGGHLLRDLGWLLNDGRHDADVG